MAAVATIASGSPAAASAASAACRRGRSAPLFGFAAALALLLSLLSAQPARAASDGNYQVAGDLAVYLGIVPAAIVRGHAAGHAEAQMHGGAPRGADDDHLVVAIFEKDTGSRVENAEITATISGLGHVGRTRIALEPMPMAGATTYGAFVSLPGGDRYSIEIDIRRPATAAPTHVTFAYERERE